METESKVKERKKNTEGLVREELLKFAAKAASLRSTKSHT